MKITRSHDILLVFTFLLAGCAASAIDDDGGTVPLDYIGDDGGSDDPEPDPTPTRDAAVRDASSTPPKVADAGVKAIADAALPRAVDASTPATSVDASTPIKHDAATPTAPVDAGKPVTPPDAAVPTNPNNGNSCQKDADCKESCLPIGVATCCRDDKTCGCTWTPGIYCL